MQIKTNNQLNESIFTLSNQHGNILRGVVHCPAEANGIGLVLIPAGTKYSVGAHTINVKLARLLVESGYTVLRVDTEGLGYSDGQHFHGTTVDAWREVQAGEQVDDAVRVVTAFKQDYGLTKVILGGICGAAVTAQYVAREAPELLDGILAINPTIIEIQKVGESQNTSAATTQRDFKLYIQKILSPSSWLRLFSGKSNFSGIYQSVSTMVKLKLVKNYAPAGVNTELWQSLKVATDKNIKNLFLFSANDDTWYDFQEFIIPTIIQKTPDLHAVVEIPQANHELHFEEWQQQAYVAIQQWLGSFKA